MIAVRGIDLDLWLQIRAEAVRQGVTAGEMLNKIMAAWLDRELSRTEEKR